MVPSWSIIVHAIASNPSPASKSSTSRAWQGQSTIELVVTSQKP
jgi:hypothetical protein